MKNLLQNDLGRALRTARVAAGLAQEAFGDVSGRTYISQLERGERHATLSKIDDLARVLDIHPLSLVALAYLPQRVVAGDVEQLTQRVREELLELLDRC